MKDVDSIEPLAQRAARAAGWSALEIASRYLTQFAVTIFLARLLVPSDFGVVAVLLVFTAISGVLVNGGFGLALIQRAEIDDSDATTVFIATMCAAVFVCVLLWLAVPAISGFFAQPLLEPLAKICFLVVPISALCVVPDALLTRRLDFRSRAKVELVASISSGVSAVCMAKGGMGAVSLVGQVVVAALVRAMLVWLYAGWTPRGQFRRIAFSRLFRFGGYMMAANLMSMVSVRLQLLVLGRFFGAQVVGQYTLAQNIQEAPAQFLAGVMGRVGLPTFASARALPGGLAAAMRASLRVSMFIFAPCMFGLAAVSDALIAVLFGPQWLVAAPVLSILAVASVTWPLHLVNLSAYSAVAHADLVFRLEIVKFFVSVPLLIVGCLWGLVGMAGAVALSSLLCVLINGWNAKRLLSYGLLSQVGDSLGVLLLAMAVAFLARVCLIIFGTGVCGLLIGVGVAATVYACAAALLRFSAWKVSLTLIKGIVGGRGG